jgi:hypothetical protein
MKVFGRRAFVLFLAGAAVAGCASSEYRAAGPGVIGVSKMRVTLGEGWRRVPGTEVPEKLSTSRFVSRDGLESDRLMMIGSVGNGDTIFRDSVVSGLPAFDATMSPEAIADLVAASLQAALWGGIADVRASNVVERGFTGIPGFQFDLAVEVPGEQNHLGIAAGFVVEDRLFVNIFVAAAPGAFERHREVAQAVLDSAVVTIKTIRH